MLLLSSLAFAEQPLIIVFPLDGPSDGGIPPWLGEGIAESISDQLKGRELRSVDRSERIRIVESLDLPPGAQLSLGSIIRAAQRADADLVATGKYSGTERNLRISVRVLNIRTLKLSGEMVANGPLSALAQMENELAWLIIDNTGFEKALSREKFHERIRTVPNTAYAYYVQSLGAPSETDQLHLLLRAVESCRDFADAQLRLGRLYFRRGDCGSAIPHLLLGRSEPSADIEVDFMRGTCFLQGDQLPSAIQAFWQLLQIARPLEALNNIGVAYLRKGDLELALDALLEAKNAARTDPIISLNLALTRHLQGNLPAAKTILEEACRSNPKNGMLQFVLGVVLKAQGENEKATAATGKARGLGVNVGKLQSDDPIRWSRIFSEMGSR